MQQSLAKIDNQERQQSERNQDEPEENVEETSSIQGQQYNRQIPAF
ncbi:Protein CBG26206 [Caenorhabditis briggsae]|uniref:Protein CBG26206 n=1 Tax=Caenorhabditis briggsae TaxID=6238 RepID=B6ILV1_CAEBR|nr:Protein CBG26206 [Caenorhabditis briggsae]CAS00881.1 Protein CBG26206 [Caenorhabditis briggsae]